MRMTLYAGLIVDGKLDGGRRILIADASVQTGEIKMPNGDLEFKASRAGACQIAIWRPDVSDPIAIVFAKAVTKGETIKVTL